MKIKIEEYNSNWPARYKEEEGVIIKALDKLFLAIDHIGSTSVIGLGAKPIIDILIGLKDESYLNEVIDPMIGAGYTYFKIYEADMPYRRLFVKLKPLTSRLAPKIIDIDEEYISGEYFMPVTNIHIVVKDTHHWTRHIAFRDYLRVHSDIKDKYHQLKYDLSQREFSNHLEYNIAKDSFVKEKEQLALNWFQDQTEKSNH